MTRGTGEQPKVVDRDPIAFSGGGRLCRRANGKVSTIATAKPSSWIARKRSMMANRLAGQVLPMGCRIQENRLCS